MARSSYGAPGVYVEEVASARQPIAGVGTNTAAFIGIVPDIVYCPVANRGYDPVTAAAMLTLANASAAATGAAAAADADARREVGAKLSVLKTNLEAKQAEAAAAAAEVTAKTADRDSAKTERDGLPESAEPPARSAADRKVSGAERALQRATAAKTQLDADAAQMQSDINALQAGMPPVPPAGGAGAPPPAGGAAPVAGAAGAAPAGGPPTPAESEDFEYKDIEPPAGSLQPSLLQPYYFVPVTVQADEFATKLCTNFTEYTEKFGDFSGFAERDVMKDGQKVGTEFLPMHPGHHYLTHAVSGFFRNGGSKCFVARVRSEADLEKALQRFESIDEVAIIAAPGLPKSPNVWGQLQDYCEDPNHQNVFAILDSQKVANDGESEDLDIENLQYDSSQAVLPRMSNHAAFYFPFIEVNDPAKRVQDEDLARAVPAKYRGLTHVAPSGHMAGVYARTDEERGVHKAPANAVVRGALEVKYYVSKAKQDLLNPQGVNCIRIMNGTVVVWGARTIGGDRNGEWKYINVRRFAGFLEESIDEGTQWVVFEPNDPALWSKIRLNITAFLTNVWRNGALFGTTAEEAFYVKCDAELNPPEVRDLGQVITEIGVSIVRPAEFVIFRISQSTGAQQG